MKKNASIKDIAELSGVSTATVSRVLNNNGRFSDETKKRVLAVIEENHYQTNSLAKALRENKSKMIGMIVPDIKNEFFSLLINKIEKNFFEKGFSTIICNTDRNPEKEEAYLKSLDSKIIDGLVYISGKDIDTTFQLSRNIPTIFIDRRPKTSTNAMIIESDNFNGGYLATKYLVERGCRKILLLTKENNISSVNDRVEGYRQAMKDMSLELNDDNFVVSPLSLEHYFHRGKKAIEERIALNSEFDGIFATNDWLAYGAIRALEENSISVPDKVKVIGFDNDTISKYNNPEITTISQNVAEIADKASEMLYTLINEPKHSLKEKKLIIPVELIIRGTT